MRRWLASGWLANHLLAIRWLANHPLANRWLALDDSEAYRRVLAVWFGLFCAGLFVLPGDWPPRALFYGGLPLTLPGVAAVLRPLWASTLAKVLAGFLLYSALSALWSPRWLTVGDQARKALCIAYFLAICGAIGCHGYWRGVLRGVQVFAAVAATVLAANYLWHCTECSRYVGYGRFANANYTASTTGALALLCLTSVLSAPGRGLQLMLVCQIPIGFLLVLTGSRAALLAYMAGVGLSLVLLIVRHRGMPAAGAVRRALLAALGCGLLIGAALAWRGSAWLSAEVARGDNHRLQIWAANVRLIEQRPWFGHGSTAPDPFTEAGTVVGYHAHNLFLAQAFYGGVIGMLLWMAVFVLAAGVARRAWRDGGDVMPLVGLWFLFAVGMVDIGPVVVDIQAIWLYVWVVLGIVLSYDVARHRRMIAPNDA